MSDGRTGNLRALKHTHSTTNVLASGPPVESGFDAAYTTGRHDP